MSLYVKLAWRNILRNKRRTFIAGTAIGIGLAALIFTDALMIGMEDHMIHSGTASYLGEGQIHRRGFRQTHEVEETIVDLDKVVEAIESSPAVQSYSLRVLAFCMISSPSNVQGVQLVGVDPVAERRLSQIDDVIVEGGYFEGDGNDILIGSKLAEILEVEIGDRAVVTSAQAHTGDLTQELFRVGGIYHLGIREMDRSMAFVRLERAQRMFNLDGQVHEIALDLSDAALGRDESLALWRRLSSDDNEAAGWAELMPQLKAALEFTGFSTLIIALVLFGVVSLGIVNTLFMSIYERMFEFGVLRAVGTRPRGVARLVLSEAGALAIVSIVFGTLLGLLLLAVFMRVGIDYTGIEYAGVTFRERIYPVVRWMQFVKYPSWVFALTVLVGLYPAIYAARLTPARALRKSF